VGACGFDGFRQKQDTHESLPRFGPSEGKDLYLACVILYCWHSWSCYNGGADEIWLWSKKMHVLAYACEGDKTYARLDCSSLLFGRPSSPLYEGRGLEIRFKLVTGNCEP
jgi:hypothetical protein